MEASIETQTILVPTKEAKAIMERAEKPEDREATLARLVDQIEKCLTYENCQKDNYLKPRIQNKNEIRLHYIEEYRPIKEIAKDDKALLKEVKRIEKKISLFSNISKRKPLKIKAISKASNCTLKEKEQVITLTKFKPKRNTIVVRKVQNENEFKEFLDKFKSNIKENASITKLDFRAENSMVFIVGSTEEFTLELYQFLLNNNFKEGEKNDCQLCEQIIESKPKINKNQAQTQVPMNIFPQAHMMYSPIMGYPHPFYTGPIYSANPMNFKNDEQFDNNINNPNMNPGNMGGIYRSRGGRFSGSRGRRGRFQGGGIRGGFNNNRGRGGRRMNSKDGGGPINVSDQDFPALSNKQSMN